MLLTRPNLLPFLQVVDLHWITGTFSLGAAVTGTTITKADPPVCTATAHGFVNGDIVVFSALTNMPQIAEIFFTVGSVTANTFELTYMDTNTANFTAESAFTVRKVIGFPSWNQSSQAPVAITTGGTTAVTFAAAGSNFAGRRCDETQLSYVLWIE